MEKIVSDKIISKLPYGKDFCFVNEIIEVDNEFITATILFPKQKFYYYNHFKHMPVVPGVIIIEAMGQAGIVSHLIYITKSYLLPVPITPLLSNIRIDFFKTPDYEKKYIVKGEKILYRFGLLKSRITLCDENDDIYANAVASVKIFNTPNPKL